MAQPWNALRLRVASAIVLGPIALAAVWFGPPWTTIIVGVAGMAMAWELGRVATARPFGTVAAILMATVALAVGVAALHRFSLALAIGAAGAGAAASARREDWAWIGAGALWIVTGCVAFLWLAEISGRTTVFILLMVVWMTDIGAYAVGKALGGPRLAPRLSPNKTWAGVIGGLVSAAFVGIVAALATRMPIISTTCVTIALSCIAQAGDLAESWGKRHFAVKDTSDLIPGHGGVLDRLDGLLAATQALALLTIVSKLHIG